MLFQIKYPADSESVQIAGNFNAWQGESGVVVDGYHVFAVDFDQDLVFKFIVDGDWKVYGEYEIVREGFNENNVLKADKEVEQHSQAAKEQTAVEQAGKGGQQPASEVPNLIGGYHKQDASDSVDADVEEHIAVGLPESQKQEVPVKQVSSPAVSDTGREVIPGDQVEPVDLDTVPNLIKSDAPVEEVDASELEVTEDVTPVDNSIDLNTEDEAVAPIDLGTVPNLIKQDTAQQVLSDKSDILEQVPHVPIAHAPIPDVYLNSIDTQDIDTTKYSMPLSKNLSGKIGKDGHDVGSDKQEINKTSIADAFEKSVKQETSNSDVIENPIEHETTNAGDAAAIEKLAEPVDIDESKSAPLNQSVKTESEPVEHETAKTIQPDFATDDTSDFEPPAKASPALPVDTEVSPSIELLEPLPETFPPNSAQSGISDYKSANTTLPSSVTPSITKPFLAPIDNEEDNMNESFMSARTGLHDSDILSTDSTEIVGELSQQSSFAAISESESHFEKIDQEDDEFIDAEEEEEEEEEEEDDDETPVHSRVNSSTNIKSYSDSTANIPGSFQPNSPEKEDKRGSLIQKFKSLFKY